MNFRSYGMEGWICDRWEMVGYDGGVIQNLCSMRFLEMNLSNQIAYASKLTGRAKQVDI